MKSKRVIPAILSLCLGMALAACGTNPSASTPSPAETTPTPGPVNTRPPIASNSDLLESMDLDRELPINIAVTGDVSGFSMAKLAHDTEAGNAALNYRVKSYASGEEVVEALKKGDADIAALHTFDAVDAYHVTDGGVQVAALDSLGMLYVVANREKEPAAALEEMNGKTVYTPTGDTGISFDLFVKKRGLDVTSDQSYPASDALCDALIEGRVDAAALSEPYVSLALAENDNLAVIEDVAAAWPDLGTNVGSMADGCVVVRREFAAEHPAELYQFIKDLGSSVAFLTVNPESAGEMAVETGIFKGDAKAAVKAIPRSNICFYTGFQMWDKLSRYLEIAYGSPTESMTGALPEDDFYYFFG